MRFLPPESSDPSAGASLATTPALHFTAGMGKRNKINAVRVREETDGQPENPIRHAQVTLVQESQLDQPVVGRLRALARPSAQSTARPAEATTHAKGPSEEPEIVTPARWPDEREAERLRQSLAGLMIDAVEDGRLEQALRQWDHDSEVVEDREVAAERMEAVDHPLVDSGGDVLPRPAPEDITESMGVVPYPLPLRTQGGPAEEKPLLSLLEPMPTLETKTDDGNMVKGQGADVSASSLSWRRRLRLLLEPSSGRWRDARRSPRSSAWPRRTCLWPLVR
eukprot:s604_g8.t1